MMKNLFKNLLYTLAGVIVFGVMIAQGATVLFPTGGGTGTSTVPTLGQVLVGQSNGTYKPQATSTLGIISGATGATTTINGAEGPTFIFSTSTTGTDFNISTSTGSVQFNWPTASASNRGALSPTDWSTFNSKQTAGNYITALTGDGSASGPGSVALTLATVNGNVGSFGSATQVGTFTVNGKGLITAAGNTTITPAASSITGAGDLTKTDDTNVTLTLGGTPIASLLKSTSLTLGWTGQLGATRGGTGQSVVTTGDLLYGSASNTWSRLADVATGNALISGGVTTAPSWGKIGLTTHVSGTLPIANGGTNNTSFSSGSVIFSDGTKLTEDNANFNYASNILTLKNSGVGITINPNSMGGTIFTGNSFINILTGNGVNDSSPLSGGALIQKTGSAGNLTLSNGSAGSSGSFQFISGAAGDSTFSGSGANNGGTGATFSLSASDGGAASGSSGTNTGGTGGSFAMLGGAGGAANGGTTAVGGPGGTYSMNSFGGGAASGATTNLPGIGGDFFLTAGPGGGIPSGGGTAARAGNLVIGGGLGGESISTTAVANAGGIGGSFVFGAGNGGRGRNSSTSNTGAAGGRFEITTGNGGAANAGTGTRVGGTGGDVTFAIGNGGATVTGTGGRGGNFTVTAGNAGTGGNINGGMLYFIGGTAVGTGTTGNIYLNSNSAGTIRGSTIIGNATTTPTARLVLSASTASLASLSVLQGVSPTTPSDGDIWNDGTNLKTSVGGASKVIVAGTSGRSTGQTGAVASVATYTVGSSDGSFEVSSNANITAFVAGTFNVQVDYTDETNTARTLTLNFSSLTGTIGIAIAATGPFEGLVSHIRCKSGTSITVKTTGTFTSLTYNVEGIIKQIS